MKTVSNFKALFGLPEDQRLKALAEAINFEFSLPQMGVELIGSQVGSNIKGVRVIDAAGVKNALPNLERIKSHLALKYATASDNPILNDVAARVETFFHSNMPEIDLGYTNLFTLVDLRGTNQDSFEIIDTNGGITFKQRAPGEKVEIRREIAESSTPVKYLTFADGIGLLDDWLRFQKFWNVEQVVAEFRSKAWDKKAEIHYGLLTAQSTGIDQAFSTDDTQTFNAAAAAILRGVRTKGYAAGQNAQFYIVCSPEKVGRILQMLEATQGSARVAFQANAQPIAYSVAGVISTTHVSASDTGYYLVLPGRKMQRGEWLDLSIEQNRDIYTRATDWVGTQQFNAIIGDTAQVRRVKYA